MCVGDAEWNDQWVMWVGGHAVSRILFANKESPVYRGGVNENMEVVTREAGTDRSLKIAPVKSRNGRGIVWSLHYFE